MHVQHLNPHRSKFYSVHYSHLIKWDSGTSNGEKRLGTLQLLTQCLEKTKKKKKRTRQWKTLPTKPLLNLAPILSKGFGTRCFCKQVIGAWILMKIYTHINLALHLSNTDSFWISIDDRLVANVLGLSECTYKENIPWVILQFSASHI